MKKKICIMIGVILGVIIIAGIITNYVDSGRVRTGHEPKYCIKIVSNDGSKVTYWGLGYKVVRYVGVSPKESYESNIGVKMGNWFMKYELPKADIIEIEYEGQTITITDIKDIGIIENILLNSKYNGEICNGINTHKITMNDEVYYLKESCKEIQKGIKQAKITQEDLDTILKIIDKYNNDENNSPKEITWEEITAEGVNEEMLFENVDQEILKLIATEIQSMIEEQTKEERENPNILLEEGWTRIFKKEQYKNVLNIGTPAMKPLYFIIYKSEKAGLYEYICSYALYELSGYNFTKEDGSLTWKNSKEFLERFNEKIIEDR